MRGKRLSQGKPGASVHWDEKSVTVVKDNKTLELSLQEGRALRDALNDLFPRCRHKGTP